MIIIMIMIMIMIMIIYIHNYMNVSEPGHAEAQLHLDQLL